MLAACVVGALSSYYEVYDEDFAAWKLEHGKVYDSVDEEVKRRMIWQKNLEMVVKHNLKYQLGHSSYELGMNAFGDLV